MVWIIDYIMEAYLGWHPLLEWLPIIVSAISMVFSEQYVSRDGKLCFLYHISALYFGEYKRIQ